MKKLFTFLLIITALYSGAQNVVAKTIQLNRYTVAGISNDSLETNKRFSYLWTESAGKRFVISYVATHGGSGGIAFDSTYVYAAILNCLKYSDTTAMFAAYRSLLDGKLSIAAAASTYQPIGSYLTASSLTPYLTISTAASTYQPIGSYLTSITSGQVTTALGFTPYNSTNPAGYISSYSETDPVWSGVASTYRTKTQNDGLYYPLSSNPSGYLTSFSETDPVYSASTWFSTTNNASSWNTAVGWGNHASAGYLTTSLAASTYSLLGHTHTFASNTSKPTTIGGYGITDFNSLGDARWSLTSHNHTLDGLSNVTITSKATGDLLKWNGTAWINFVPTYISSFTESDPVWLADKPSYLTSAIAASTYLMSSTAASTYLPINNPTATGTGVFPLLQLSSTAGGFLMNRLTTSQQNAISSPVAGTMLHNTDDSSGKYYNGAEWRNVGSLQIKNSLGVTQSIFADTKLINYTAAAAGAQQVSPSLGLYGNGWKTNATAGSQRVGFIIDVLPVQGTIAPTATMQWTIDINGAKSTPYSFTSTGSMTLTNNVNAGGTVSSFTFGANAAGQYGFTGRSKITSPSDGVLTIQNNAATDFTRFQFGGTTSSFPALARSGTQLQAVLADASGFTSIQSLYDRFGSGTPEGVITAPVGAVYHRTDGGANTSFYVKESGTGNTGWIAK